MDGQIFPDCGSSNIFTGVSDCWRFDGKPKGVILTTESFEIPPEIVSEGTLGTYLQEQALNPTNTQVFPLLYGLVNLEPSGGDVRTNTEGWGGEVPNGNNAYSEVYTYTKGGLCLFKAAAKLKGRPLRVFFVDDDNIAYGTFNVKTGGVRGFSCGVGVQYRRNTGTALAGILLSVYYTTAFFKDFENNATSFIIPDNMIGLRAWGVVNVKPVVRDSGVDDHFLYVKFGLQCSGIGTNDVIQLTTAEPEVINLTTGVTAGLTTVGYRATDGYNTINMTPSGFLHVGDRILVRAKPDAGTPTLSERLLTINAAVGEDFIYTHRAK